MRTEKTNASRQQEAIAEHLATESRNCTSGYPSSCRYTSLEQ